MYKDLKNMSNKELWKIFSIILRSHNPNYLIWYKKEVEKLKSIIDSYKIERISHIGSTCVKDLIAKPTIDILLEIPKDSDLEYLWNILEQNEYICNKQKDDFSNLSLMCMKGYTSKGFSKKVFHLHIRIINNHNELYFRDYLQNFSDVAHEYGKLKQTLAKQYKNHRDNYTKGKTEFIKKYTNFAKKLYKNRYKP